MIALLSGKIRYIASLSGLGEWLEDCHARLTDLQCVLHLGHWRWKDAKKHIINTYENFNKMVGSLDPFQLKF